MIKSNIFPWDSGEPINFSINVNWSDWHSWKDLELDKITVPTVSGVYEVRPKNYEECFDIGKATSVTSSAP